MSMLALAAAIVFHAWASRYDLASRFVMDRLTGVVCENDFAGECWNPWAKEMRRQDFAESVPRPARDSQARAYTPFEDEKFRKAPIEQQRAYLDHLVPGFSKLPIQDQDRFIRDALKSVAPRSRPPEGASE